MRVLIGLLFLAVSSSALGSSALAQDMPGALSLPDVSRSLVIGGTAEGYAQRSQRSQTGRSPQAMASRSAQTCANVPATRVRLGVNDFRVRKLEQLCAQLGYSTR